MVDRLAPVLVLFKSRMVLQLLNLLLLLENVMEFLEFDSYCNQNDAFRTVVLTRQSVIEGVQFNNRQLSARTCPPEIYTKYAVGINDGNVVLATAKIMLSSGAYLDVFAKEEELLPTLLKFFKASVRPARGPG